MSKKTRRQMRRDNATFMTTAPAPVITNPGRSNEFNPDYSHVVSDLKRIGTLAGSFLVILIVLSFFLK